ncbi:MAG TPA: NAD(P)/FAD-dependent oxidoreductase [Bryobacterales bacterium]|nr:NAD(P)/FAD-dependent oxidoreductase [Bryobacterales bacterium]
MPSYPVVIMGAGPAGLTAAYELAKGGVPSITLEAENIVGGLAQTATYKGYRFDIGGHRFFTKVSAVEQLWKEILPDDLLRRSRLSRIYYNGKFFAYPLKPFNALMGLGLIETFRCVASYGWARMFPRKPENDFATWVSNRFGNRLFSIFFKTYTEKVWGIPCTEIQAEWAAQRIKGLSLFTAVKNALIGETATRKDDVVKTLIDEFLYPRFGPGMMWERATELIEQRGGSVVLNSPVTRINWEDGRVIHVEAGGEVHSGEHFISSIAIRDLIECLSPAPPENVLAAARKLKYRDFLTVALMLRGTNLFPDNWIYIHDSSVAMGRVQNFGNWSPEMIPEPDTSCLGLEYFCSEGDDIWDAPDHALVERGKREISRLGLANADDVFDGAVVRMKKAYPVYDGPYAAALSEVREFLKRLPNLQLTGRNGMHRYNNQDHSMLTAMLAARNILGGRYDLWQVNVDQEYHEEGKQITLEEIRQMEATQPLVPRRLDE